MKLGALTRKSPRKWAIPSTCLLAVLCLGCAARVPHSDRIPAEQKLWSTCVETVPVNADGFQHFTCQDFQRKKSYEVLVRLTPEVKSKKRKEESK